METIEQEQVVQIHDKTDDPSRQAERSDEQSEIMAEALEAAGKYYEIRTFPGQNHSILDEGSREGVLQEIITFVNTHIGSN